jgi:hypothetical protein
MQDDDGNQCRFASTMPAMVYKMQPHVDNEGQIYGSTSYPSRSRVTKRGLYGTTIKTGIFGRPTPKVHLGWAWRIEFPYRNIRD